MKIFQKDAENKHFAYCNQTSPKGDVINGDVCTVQKKKWRCMQTKTKLGFGLQTQKRWVRPEIMS